MNLADCVAGRLSTIQGVDHIDGGLLKSPTRPYTTFSGGVEVSVSQRYAGGEKRVAWEYSVMVVSNSAAGCRFLAEQVTTVLNDLEHESVFGDGMWSALDYPGPLILDDNIEGDWAYSITIYFIARTEGV